MQRKTPACEAPIEMTSSPAHWFGVGRSIDPDPGRAGRRAARDAISGDDPRLLIVFCSDRYDLDALASSLCDIAGDDVPVIGCSTAGEIATSGPGDAGVVVVAFGGEGFAASAACARDASRRLRAAGAEVASAVEDVSSYPHRVLLLLSDGLAGDQMEVVRGAYGVTGAAVPLVGGCAGDDLRMVATRQIFGREVMSGAVVGVALGSTTPLGIGVRHGWRRVGEPMLVTSSTGNRIYGLDDEPALDVYLRRLDAPPEARADPTAFTRFALTHPLGLSRRSREEVRFVADANFADRSIGVIAAVPQGGMTWLMEGDDASVLEATDDACREALTMLDGHDPLGFVVFDCIARRGVLGEAGIEREVQRISDHAAGAPVAGFYTYGEFARTRGTGGFHNQTLVVLAVS